MLVIFKEISLLIRKFHISCDVPLGLVITMPLCSYIFTWSAVRTWLCRPPPALSHSCFCISKFLTYLLQNISVAPLLIYSNLKMETRISTKYWQPPSKPPYFPTVRIPSVECHTISVTITKVNLTDIKSLVLALACHLVSQYSHRVQETCTNSRKSRSCFVSTTISFMIMSSKRWLRVRMVSGAETNFTLGTFWATQRCNYTGWVRLSQT
jgi:hypothetical protein